MITKSQTASSVKKIEALRQEREQKEAEEAKKVEEFKRQLGEVLYACAYEPSSKWSKFRGGSVRELFAEIGIREAPPVKRPRDTRAHLAAERRSR